MSLLYETIIFATVFAAAFICIGWFRTWTLKHGPLDLPNDRSSHTEPTPRGGGIVIASIVIAVYIANGLIFGYRISPGYIIGALAIVGVSWFDDLYSLSFIWRLLVHAFAAAMIIYDLGHIEGVYLPLLGQNIEFGRMGLLLTFGWIVWLINGYNFMDGIDGLAGIQAVVAGLGWLVIGHLADATPAITVGGSIFFASIGFLLHNWQPAKVFMGDAGSAFLGFTFASMPLIMSKNIVTTKWLIPLAAASFVWMFVFDSAITLISRLFRGDKVWHAHRQHVYQQMVIAGRSHQFVATAYGLLGFVITIYFCFAFWRDGILLEILVPVVVAISTLLLVLFRKAVSVGRQFIHKAQSHDR